MGLVIETELSTIRNARLLLTQFGHPEESPEPHFKTRLTGDRFEVRLRNQLNQAGVAAECARWMENRVQVKATKSPGIIPQTLFYVGNSGDENLAIQGSSQFTSTGLVTVQTPLSFAGDPDKILQRWLRITPPQAGVKVVQAHLYDAA